MRGYIVNQSIKHQKCYSWRGPAAFYSQPFLRNGSYWCLDIRNINISEDFENIFFKKQEFLQPPESIKKSNSKYNGCRSVRKCI